MRLTFIGPVPPIRGGIAQHGGYLAAELAREHELTVVSWRHQYPRLLYRRPQVDPDAPAHPAARFDLRWWDPTSWWRAGRVARRGDVVVLVWATPVHALTYRLIIAMAPRLRVVAVAHNATPHEAIPFQRALTRWVLSRCDGVVTHSAAEASTLRDLLGEGVRNETVPMPSHMAVEPQPLPPVDGGLRLLFFGFIRPYKGLDVALDALVELRRRGARHRLTVVGEPWGGSESWPRQVADRGLEDQVDLQLRYAADAEVSDLLAKHHAVVLPYRSATQSGIVPIAFAAGRPVVATAVGGLRDVVREGQNGALAEPNDPASLADAIERCAAHLPDLAAGMSAGAPTWGDVASAVARAAGTDER